MATIKLRRGTAAEWAAADAASSGDSSRLLAAGEPGFITDTGEYMIGDGVTVSADLPKFLNDAALAGTKRHNRPRPPQGGAGSVIFLAILRTPGVPSKTQSGPPAGGNRRMGLTTPPE